MVSEFGTITHRYVRDYSLVNVREDSERDHQQNGCLRLVGKLITATHEFGKSLTCTICQSLYSNPATAPCLHTFCYECLVRSVALKSVCPLCKTSCRKREIRKDERLARILENFREFQEFSHDDNDPVDDDSDIDSSVENSFSGGFATQTETLSQLAEGFGINPDHLFPPNRVVESLNMSRTSKSDDYKKTEQKEIQASFTGLLDEDQRDTRVPAGHFKEISVYSGNTYHPERPSFSLGRARSDQCSGQPEEGAITTPRLNQAEKNACKTSSEAGVVTGRTALSSNLRKLVTPIGKNQLVNTANSSDSRQDQTEETPGTLILTASTASCSTSATSLALSSLSYRSRRRVIEPSSGSVEKMGSAVKHVIPCRLNLEDQEDPLIEDSLAKKQEESPNLNFTSIKSSACDDRSCKIKFAKDSENNEYEINPTINDSASADDGKCNLTPSRKLSQQPKTKSKENVANETSLTTDDRKHSSESLIGVKLLEDKTKASVHSRTVVPEARLQKAKIGVIANKRKVETEAGLINEKNSAKHRFQVGDQVTVIPRTSPGENKLGGAARITHVSPEGLYGVKYALGGSEKLLESRFISPGLDLQYILGGRVSAGENKARRKSGMTRRSKDCSSEKDDNTSVANNVHPEKTKKSSGKKRNSRGSTKCSSVQDSVSGLEKRRQRRRLDNSSRLSVNCQPKIALTGNFGGEKRRKLLSELVQRLDGDIIESDIEAATHIVAATKKKGNLVLACGRTLKYMIGICCGKWILSSRWVKDSLDAGHWLDEEAYEVDGDMKSAHLGNGGPKRARLKIGRIPSQQKNSIASLNRNTILKGYYVYLLGDYKSEVLTKSTITQFVTHCGGMILSESKQLQEVIENIPKDAKSRGLGKRHVPKKNVLALCFEAELAKEDHHFKYVSTLVAKKAIPKAIDLGWLLDGLSLFSLQPRKTYEITL